MHDLIFIVGDKTEAEKILTELEEFDLILNKTKSTIFVNQKDLKENPNDIKQIKIQRKISTWGWKLAATETN